MRPSHGPENVSLEVSFLSVFGSATSRHFFSKLSERRTYCNLNFELSSVKKKNRRIKIGIFNIFTMKSLGFPTAEFTLIS